jgi:hypothetical protein
MTAATSPANAAARAAAPHGLWERLSDRLNPILVREVQQAVKGRSFLLMVFGVLLVSVAIAVAVAADGEASQRNGRDAFSAGLAILVPLVLFVVPMHAYHAMRLELRAGIAEQLLLSRLGPYRIVLGKLSAAMVQYFLYLSVVAPVLALTYLLRGVDVPTIAVALAFSFVFCVAATAFALSAAAQAVLPSLQGLSNVAVAFALGALTVGMIGFVASGEFVRSLGWAMRSPEWPMIVTMMLVGTVCGIVLSGMVAASLLTHGFENRSTPFRGFLLVMVVISFGWLAVFVEPRHWDDAVPAVVSFLAMLGGAFGLFMLTETARLSPRHAAFVPTNRTLAVLLAPLLPGRHRGLLFLLGYFVLIAGVGAGCLAFAPRPVSLFGWRFAAFTMVYLVIYLSLGKLLRRLLPETLVGSNASRALLPLLPILGCGVPALCDALVGGGIRRWHPGHALNPFWTMDDYVGRSGGDQILVWLAIVAAVLLGLQLPAVLKSLGEVAAAARAHQAPAAALVATTTAPEVPGAA